MRELEIYITLGGYCVKSFLLLKPSSTSNNTFAAIGSIA